MRFIRYGEPGAEQPAVLDGEGRVLDLGFLAGEVDAALLSDETRLSRISEALEEGRLDVIADSVEDLERLGPPVARPGKVVGIGLNYRDHAAEAGAEPPETPVVFLKATTAIIGPGDAIVLPIDSLATDWEVELGVVVGTLLRGTVGPEEALAAVAGYLAANDVTERDHARSGPTWAKGKCHDTFLPLGPWVRTAGDIPDAQSVSLSLSVNGTQRQSSSTAQMIFSIPELLVHVAAHMTLEPGDIVLTGTPGGVAAGQPEPKPFLRPGDVVEASVEGLGKQRNVVAAPA